MKHKVLQGIACKARAAQAGHALRVAQLVGVTVDDVLCGRFPRPGACPTCGRA